MDYTNHVMLQFKLDSSKRTVALRQHPIIELVSNRYIQGATFWGSRGSKCGTYLDPEATHWALVNVTNPDEPVFVIYDKFPTEYRVPKIYKINGNYLVIRKFTKYFKYQISEFSSIKELREAVNAKP